MIALAMTEGVSVIGLFGVNYGTEGEYMRQRGSAEFWLGRAVQSGVRVVLPAQCDLLADPVALYGYESHDEETGLLKDVYKATPFKVITPLKPGEVYERAKPPKELLAVIAAEEAEYPRPDWALGPLPQRTDGQAIGER
jgi:hypothetical protein